MFKRFGFWVTGVLIGLCLSGPAVLAQSKGAASISGTVMLGGKPAKGVPVVASLSGNTPGQKPSTATATTDDDGHYRITGLASGRYSVSPYQPTSVLPERTPFDPGGKNVVLGENEAVTGIDFTMSAGCVITGRIVGPDGRPLIEQRITVEAPDAKNSFASMMGGDMYRTDDRGIYRIYGLAPGKYIVSAGEEKGSDSVVVGLNNRSYFPRTFYPGVTDRSQAQVLDLSEGGIASDIDISVATREKNFSISGRMLDGATGKAVADVPAAYAPLKPGDTSIHVFGSSTKSDSSGQFKMNGLKPGRYAVFAGTFFTDDSKWTSDPVEVEITDSDLSDVEVKLHAGININGSVVVDGSADAETIGKARQLHVQLFGSSPSNSAGIQAPGGKSAQVNEDLSFHMGGIMPGRYMVYVFQNAGDQIFFTRSVEVDGIPVNENSVEIPNGVDTVNLRVHLETGTGIIRGQVTVVGGDVPAGWRLTGSVRRPGPTPGQSRPMAIDSRGSFVIDHLASGEYEVSAGLFPATPGTGSGKAPAPVRKTVSVSNGGETTVTLTLDLSPPKQGGDQR